MRTIVLAFALIACGGTDREEPISPPAPVAQLKSSPQLCRGQFFVPAEFQAPAGADVPVDSMLFSSKIIDDFRAAAIAWNGWAGSHIVDVDGGPCPIRPTRIADNNGADPYLAVARYQDGVIEVDVQNVHRVCFNVDVELNDCWRVILEHEIGHSFGMEHLPPGESGVMSTEFTVAEFTDADRSECRRVGVCQ